MPLTSTNRRTKQKKSRRTSVVTIQQEDGSSYFYDDPDLGGTGETSWTREELEVLPGLEEGVEEEEDDETDLNVGRERTRSRRATATSCTIDGCNVMHRYPDGHCQLHRNSV